MTLVVPVYFDYASSLCYIAMRIAERIETELDVRMGWRPVPISRQYPRLRPGQELTPDIRANIERVSGDTQIRLRIPGHWLDSRLALEGAVLAQERGCFPEYHRAVFEAVYLRGEDLGDPTVLTGVAEQVGLSAGQIDAWWQAGSGTSRLADNLDEARRAGVIGYPAFLLGEFPLTGIQPYETMRLLFLRYVERRRRELH